MAVLGAGSADKVELLLLQGRTADAAEASARLLREADTLHTPAGSRIAAVAVQSHLLNNRQKELEALLADKHGGLNGLDSQSFLILQMMQLDAGQTEVCVQQTRERLTALAADRANTATIGPQPGPSGTDSSLQAVVTDTGAQSRDRLDAAALCRFYTVDLLSQAVQEPQQALAYLDSEETTLLLEDEHRRMLQAEVASLAALAALGPTTPPTQQPSAQPVTPPATHTSALADFTALAAGPYCTMMGVPNEETGGVRQGSGIAHGPQGGDTRPGLNQRPACAAAEGVERIMSMHRSKTPGGTGTAGAQTSNATAAVAHSAAGAAGGGAKAGRGDKGQNSVPQAGQGGQPSNSRGGSQAQHTASQTSSQAKPQATGHARSESQVAGFQATQSKGGDKEGTGGDRQGTGARAESAQPSRLAAWLRQLRMRVALFVLNWEQLSDVLQAVLVAVVLFALHRERHAILGLLKKPLHALRSQLTALVTMGFAMNPNPMNSGYMPARR